eukprot:CAMPEP_0201627738 /NCGR_PEP_ID=MMETSP0493-20130528/2860_1 /ASSEMBLY_ACC=CAM_ASM_000838 /TAXON_ID=420259 /ORGANISM="Thalassiosira gravida, Strain GMp14c1" /LENGTH=33 /DNA_ID= /DNA_START= /DNA_END= /DNA_ORIENTATION=
MDFGGAAMGGAAADAGFDFMSWYMDIPVISRLY